LSVIVLFIIQLTIPVLLYYFFPVRQEKINQSFPQKKDNTVTTPRILSEKLKTIERNLEDISISLKTLKKSDAKIYENIEKKITGIEKTMLAMENSSKKTSTIIQNESKDEINNINENSLRPEMENIKNDMENIKQMLTAITKTLQREKSETFERSDPNEQIKYLLQLRLSKYYQKNKKYPETISEIESAIAPVPEEKISNQNRIFLEYNGKGGWHYDITTKKFHANIKE